jgi:DNA-binding beta-propeller fold protein YncE
MTQMTFKKSLSFALIALTWGVLVFYRTAPVEGQSSTYANFEGAQTSPIRLSPDGTRLFAVNTANASLSVFDVSAPSFPVLVREIPVGLEPVSVNPRTNDEAWVVNQLSDSVSVVSVSSGMVIETLQVPDEPMDVVFAGDNQAYVSVSRSNAIVVYDVATRTPVRALPLMGGNPRALAVSPDRTRVYAAFALSGNASTVIRADLAPPPPPPTNPNLPPAPHVAKIVDSRDAEWQSIIDYRMPDNDVAVIATEPFPFVAQYVSGVGTVNLGLAVNPANGDIFVANTDARNLVQFEPNVRGHWVDNRITRIEIGSGTVTPFDLNPAIDYSILPNPAARATALAQPTAVEFDPSGAFMYVAAFGTDRVARVDTNGEVLSFVEVSSFSGSGPRSDPRTKRGPRGLALTGDGQTLFVMNRIANTISVIDTTRDVVVRETRVGRDVTPLSIRLGRGFLYDAKLSGNGTGSCASCHVDADMDMLAWDLGNPGGEMSSFRQGDKVLEFHPMKGPMTTQTLRGLAQMAPLHWRGDKLNFMQFAGAFDSLMGGEALSDADMLAFTVFVNTLLFQPNPNQNLDRTMPSSLLQGDPNAGLAVYLTEPLTRPGRVTCNACHLITPGPGSNRVIVSQPPQPLKVPHLRNLYQKLGFNRFLPSTIDGFGMDHDGHVSTFLDFFAGQAFVDYSVQQKKDLAAFLLAFDTGTAPAVGHAVTVTPATVNDAQRQADWVTLEIQAKLRASDLVVHGTLNGQLQKLTFRPFFSDYVVDAFPTISLTRNQLVAAIERGDTLTVMGVAPSQGLTSSATATALPMMSLTPGRRQGH